MTPQIVQGLQRLFETEGARVVILTDFNGRVLDGVELLRHYASQCITFEDGVKDNCGRFGRLLVDVKADIG